MFDEFCRHEFEFLDGAFVDATLPVVWLEAAADDVVVDTRGVVVSKLIDDKFVVEEEIVWVVVALTDDVDDFDRIRVVVEGVTKRVVDEGLGAAENGLGMSESISPIGPSMSISDSGHDNSSGWME